MLQFIGLLALLAFLILVAIVWRGRVKRPSISITFSEIVPKRWTLMVVPGQMGYQIWYPDKYIRLWYSTGDTPTTWEQFKTEYTNVPCTESDERINAG